MYVQIRTLCSSLCDAALGWVACILIVVHVLPVWWRLSFPLGINQVYHIISRKCSCCVKVMKRASWKIKEYHSGRGNQTTLSLPLTKCSRLSISIIIRICPCFQEDCSRSFLKCLTFVIVRRLAPTWLCPCHARIK